MITKERLQELIKQGATIYSIFGGLQRIGLRFGENFIKDNKLYEIDERKVEKNEAQIFIGELGSLFETKEDALWELEMTETRIETLKMPRFEEFMLNYKGVHRFHTKDGQIVKINGFYDERPNIQSGFIDVCVNGHCVKDWEFTKENYIEACKLCLRLFKGE